MKASVCLIAYRQRATVEAAMLSALGQRTSFDFEIVAGDDGSDDGTREILEALARGEPDRVRVLPPASHFGLIGNFLRTLSACRGEYVALLDGDDTWTRDDKLQRQSDFLDAHPECSLCFHDVAVLGPDGRDPRNYTPEDQPRFCGIEALLARNPIATCSAMLRRAAVPEIPAWYHDSSFEDWPLYLLLAQRGRIGYLDEVMAEYRNDGRGLWSGRGRVAQLQASTAFLRILKRHFDPEQGPLIQAGIERHEEETARATPRRAALLQFHDDFEVCRDRVETLRAFNPGLAVHGLFGGPHDAAAEAEARLGPSLDSFLALGGSPARWKKYTDLAVREWYRQAGERLPFDMLHVIQWDLLLCDSLDALYATIPADALGLTGLTPLAAIADRWHWTRCEPARSESERFLAWGRDRFALDGVPLACLGPGYCLPREFLSRFADLEVPELGHDELRLPLLGQALGFRLADTGFYPAWFDARTEELFNANGDALDPGRILEELGRPGGRRAFHPCRQALGVRPIALEA